MLDGKYGSMLCLEPTDAVIVLRKDGSCEVSLPEVTGDWVPENIVMGAAVVYALQDEELYTLIHDHFQKKCSKINLFEDESVLS